VSRETNEKLSFSLTINEDIKKKDTEGGAGSLAWVDIQGKCAVRSPIAFVIEGVYS